MRAPQLRGSELIRVMLAGSRPGEPLPAARTMRDWPRVVDECGEAVPGTSFPTWSQVDPRATRDALRDGFTRWGLPRRPRVDNRMPWGARGDLPTDPLHLYLLIKDIRRISGN